MDERYYPVSEGEAEAAEMAAPTAAPEPAAAGEAGAAPLRARGAVGLGADSLQEREEQLRLVEALLFAAEAPLDPQAIAGRLPEGADVAGLLHELKRRYRARGVHVVEAEGRWCLQTAPDLAPYLRRERSVQRSLSRAALETLAIIAYHQPVTKADIENIRSVATSKGTFDVLLEAGWIKPGRRREAPGRPVTWVTTPTFLEHFSLERVEDLPGLEELRKAGLLDSRPAMTTLSDAGSEDAEDAEDAEESAGETFGDGTGDGIGTSAHDGGGDDTRQGREGGDDGWPALPESPAADGMESSDAEGV
jgi:segregation and condensation protein B